MLALAKHLLFPGFSNNHKAKLLHSSSVFALAAILVMFQISLYLLPKTGVAILGYAAQISPSEVIALTNAKRAGAGLPPVRQSAQLTNAALAKGTDMLNKDYWAHVAPDGTQPWFFFTQAGYAYKNAGENLARDFSSPGAAIEAWMASPSHRDNLLSNKYNDVGVAVVEGDLGGVDTTIIVQLFGTVAGASIAQVPAAAAQPQATVAPKPSLTPTPKPATPSPSPSPTLPPATESPTQIAQGQTNQELVSPFDTTRAISLFTVTSLLGVMAIDGYVVTKRRIPRLGGRVFAHIAFLGMILAIVLIAKAGAVL